MRSLIVWLVLASTPLRIYADAEPPMDARPRNQRGNCVWCAFETIFWGCAGYERAKGAFKGALQQGWSGASPSNVVAYCEREKIPYKQGRGYQFYRECCDAGLGCVLFIPGHAIALVGIDEQQARIIDNNGTAEVQAWPRSRFDRLAEQGICPTCPSPERPVGPRRPNAPAPTPVNPGPPSPVGPSTPVQQPVQQPAAVDLKPVLDAIAALNKKVDTIQLTPGPKGDPGPQGPKGEPGQQGPAGTVSDAILLERINSLLQQMNLTCELYDVNGNLQATSTFGPNKPLRIKLVPVKVASPN